MVAAAKKRERADLEKIAGQLAKVRLRTLPGEGQLNLKVTATFTTRAFDAGNYKVSVGLCQALLNLDHPSFEVGHMYQATLAQDTWSQTWKKAKISHASAAAGGRIGAKIFGFFNFGIDGSAGKDHRQNSEQKAAMPYPIVSTTPSGWRIGTELGDPRDPEGTLPTGLEHCLNGEYLSGQRNEIGEGQKDKTSAFVLCVLRPKVGGNDPRVIGTLLGVTGSLKVAVEPSDSRFGESARPGLRRDAVEREHELRKAFIDICLERARVAKGEGAGAESMLSGEFYLHHHEIHPPKLPPTTTDALSETKVEGNEQSASAQFKA